jgi:spermidine synthase
MALVWQKNINGISHEVRSAGNSVRLYTDGVFHSQYNPRYPAGGHVWDLLMLPAFFTEPKQIRRILVLGAGGGAVMRQLAYFTSAQEITGIDINQLHIQVARKYFGVRGKPYRLIRADAVKWLSDYSGVPYDLVIDDLYAERDGQPHRAIEADEKWFEQLNRVLSSHGVLAINFIDFQHLNRSAWKKSKISGRLFASVFRLSMHNYENVIGVFCKAPVLETEFQRRLQEHTELDQRRMSCKLNYIIRRFA